MAQALPEAQISYDRFHVIAMANEARDGVRPQEMSTQPQAVNEALGGNDPKLIKSLTWDMRRNPQGWSAKQTNAMHWLAALDSQKCVGLASEDGAACDLRQSQSGKQRCASNSGLAGLDQLGQAQPA